MNESKTFKISKKYLLERGISPFVLVFSFILAIILNDVIFDFNKVLPRIEATATFGLMMLGAALVGYLAFYFFQRKSLITVGEKSFERSNWKSKDIVLYDDIKQLKIYSFRGNVRMIRMNIKSRRLLIAGFENMNGIAEELRNNIKNSSKIKEIKQSIPWHSPYLLGLYIFVLNFLFMTAYRFDFSFVRSTAFPAIGLLIAGILSLIYKPFSQLHGKKLLAMDIVFGIMWLAGAVLFLFFPVYQ
jgi:hypothetical protein